MYEVTYNFISIIDGKKHPFTKKYKTKLKAKFEAWLLNTQLGVFDIKIENHYGRRNGVL